MDTHRLDRLLDSLHATETATPVLLRLCRVGAEVTGSAGVGLSRIVQGSHEVVEASDADTREIELLQATHAEGPCLDAIVTYRPSLEPDLASDRALERWPKFARAALGHGIAAAYAFPVINGGVAIGALDIYSTVQGDLDDDHVREHAGSGLVVGAKSPARAVRTPEPRRPLSGRIPVRSTGPVR
jgi:hypothetical protein